MLKIFVVIILALLLIIGVVYVWGYVAWQNRSASLRELLSRSMERASPSTFDPRELEGLPHCVQRYLYAALVPGQSIVQELYLEHVGEMNMSADGDKWFAFTSQQNITTQTPGFVWDARIAMFPGVRVHVHDALVDGKGLLRASIVGLITTMERDGASITYGEYLRWCAESAWYPTAMLPSQGAIWEPLTTNSARVTFVRGHQRATLTAVFGANGLLESIRAEDRGREVNGTTIPTPWEGRWKNYIRMNGMMVPSEGEVAWILPEGRKVYWRGRIVNSR